MFGGGGADTINGGFGNDTITGGVRADVMTGGRGADTFRFSTADTGTRLQAADRIVDFSHVEGDKIDLGTFDAVAGTPANEAFRFIGASAFSGVTGQFRFGFVGTGTVIQGDTDGDRAADVFIVLTGNTTLDSTDFTGVRAADGVVPGDHGATIAAWHPLAVGMHLV